MKHNFQCTLACLLALTLLICPAMAVSPFPDVSENADYAEAVKYLKDIGIMSGDDKGNFNPDKTVTRAEMATLVCRMLGETENLTVSSVFSDVPTTHWANKYVSKAAELGIVGGYGNGKFGPEDTVTFEQVVTMLIRAMNMDELAIASGGYPNGYLLVAREQGMTEGVYFQNTDILNRASVAIILYNTLHS